MQRFAGKTVIVTGAASGIGRKSAELFAAEGANVLAADISGEIEAAAASIRESGGVAEGIMMDAGSRADVDRIVDLAVSRHGGLDVFYANAGVSGGTTSLMKQTEADWLKILQINLLGPMLAIKASAPVMAKRGGGAIVVTASATGLRPSPMASPAYSASKAAVISLVQMAAMEFSESRIRVNAVCPGLIQTGMTRRLFDENGPFPQLRGRLRAGQPEQVARAALFLASDDASHVNGLAMLVDGGPTSGAPALQPASTPT